MPRVTYKFHRMFHGTVSCAKLGIKVIIEKSRDGRFYRTGIEIWAGFGPVGSTEKNIWADYEQLL